MRNFQKQQLLDIITSLHTLHRESRDKLTQKDYLTVQTALSDCQEASIQMGEAIEKMMGERTEAVTCLEQYCEKLYYISVQLESISAQKFYKSLEGCLIKVENAINHMPLRKEIIFLPYKASMWDSLESIYLAAKECEDCDAYVIPIPYYEKNPDGSLGEMHYEGNEYPEYVENMDYRNYNLQERHPDVIYIHNPYDEWNNVTCVPEMYFSRNLRNYTDCLVYVPYFVLSEFKPEDQKKIDGFKHFCFLPGVIYAHKVIVQSENMRQIYINEYIKAAKPLGLSVDRRMLEEKILGIGSPKLDKVRKVKKEDMLIPKEWLKLIKKTDGTWKKIVFYNTSINALLRHDFDMLEKMKFVFRTFKEQKEEVTLLWRPHPLIPSTIKSMRPYLWMAYKDIVEEYKRENWGIYDDTTDMDRAVLLSDFYYGDPSSVVTVYRETGKPIKIQSVQEVGWTFAACCCYGNTFYLLGSDRKHIYYFDKCERKLRLVEGIAYDELDEYSFSGIVICNDNLIAIPERTEKVNKFLIYNIVSKEICEIKLKETLRYTANYSETKEFLYVASCVRGIILEFNMENCEQKIYKVEDIFLDEGMPDSGLTKAWYCDGSLYFLCGMTNIILEFNVTTKDMIKHIVGDKKYKYIYIVGSKDGLAVLITKCGQIIVWNKDSKKMEVVCEEEYGELSVPFWKTIFVEETKEVWCFPCELNIIMIVNIESHQKTVIDMKTLNDLEIKENRAPQVYMANRYENSILISTFLAEYIVSIDIYSKEVTKEQVYIDDSCFEIAEIDATKTDWKKVCKGYGLI